MIPNFGECKKFHQCQALHENCPYSVGLRCLRLDYKNIINQQKEDYLCKYYEPDLKYMRSCIEEEKQEMEESKRKEKPYGRSKFSEPWYQELLKMEEINDDD